MTAPPRLIALDDADFDDVVVPIIAAAEDDTRGPPLNAPPDEVRLARENRVAAQLAQAIGRIRLRTMTSGIGACEPCDVFLRLPDWRRMVQKSEHGVCLLPRRRWPYSGCPAD